MSLFYEIKIPENKKYIFVKVNKEMTRELAGQIAPKADEIGIRLGINNLLFDLRESKNTDTLDNNMTFAYEDLPEAKGSHFKKVGVLLSPEDTSHNLVIVALKKKGFNINIFKDIEEASIWFDRNS